MATTDPGNQSETNPPGNDTAEETDASVASDTAVVENDPNNNPLDTSVVSETEQPEKTGEKQSTLADVMAAKKTSTQTQTTIKLKNTPVAILKGLVVPLICCGVLVIFTIYMKNKILGPSQQVKHIVLTPAERQEITNDTNARKFLSDIQLTIGLYYARHHEQYPVIDSYAGLIKILKKSGEYRMYVVKPPALPAKYIFQYCSRNGKEYSLRIIKGSKKNILSNLGNDKCTPKP